MRSQIIIDSIYKSQKEIKIEIEEKVKNEEDWLKLIEK